tara:strand:+ start:21531 stop:22652 length:1122 start_codon:yes stop_codon:yes gene_type:complete
MQSPVVEYSVNKWLHKNCNQVHITDESIIEKWYDSTLVYDEKGKSASSLNTSFRTFKSITKRTLVDKTVQISDYDVSKKGYMEWLCKKAGNLAIQNVEDLLVILKWNAKNNIRIFRMSSSLFPWMSEYDFNQLPNYNQIKSKLAEIGKYILENNLRVGFHPGQFCVLPSPNEKIVYNSINELDKHSTILDLMGLPKNHNYSLNIHVGGAYGNKKETLSRFVKNFSKLSESTKARLVVENDDKASQYSVIDLYEGLYKHINIPITFDFFHHLFCTGGLSQEKAAKLAASTWPASVRPLAHFSSSKRLNEDSSVMERSHADYLYDAIPQIGNLFDIEIEAKSKELALFDYVKKSHSMELRPTIESKVNKTLKLNL